jgi:hypothetical protein
MLLYMAENGFEIVLPELLAFLGEERFVAFLKIFSGRTISVPTWKEFKEVATMIGVWQDYSKLHSGRSAPMQELVGVARRYGLTTDEASKLYVKMNKYVSSLEGTKK